MEPQTATFSREMQSNLPISLTVMKDDINIKHCMNGVVSKSHASVMTGF